MIWVRIAWCTKSQTERLTNQGKDRTKIPFRFVKVLWCKAQFYELCLHLWKDKMLQFRKWINTAKICFISYNLGKQNILIFLFPLFSMAKFPNFFSKKSTAFYFMEGKKKTAFMICHPHLVWNAGILLLKVFFNSFIGILLTYHKVYPRKVHSSVGFSMVIILQPSPWSNFRHFHPKTKS